jgi:hypothetical protein
MPIAGRGMFSMTDLNVAAGFISSHFQGCGSASCGGIFPQAAF